MAVRPSPAGSGPRPGASSRRWCRTSQRVPCVRRLAARPLFSWRHRWLRSAPVLAVTAAASALADGPSQMVRRPSMAGCRGIACSALDMHNADQWRSPSRKQRLERHFARETAAFCNLQSKPRRTFSTLCAGARNNPSKIACGLHGGSANLTASAQRPRSQAGPGETRCSTRSFWTSLCAL